MEATVPEIEVRVRRTAPFEAPLSALVNRTVGSVAAFRARHRFHEFIQHFANSARGLEGVLAASIELHPHQLRVVRQVVRDPFQRYLLADEVGLGKTIEAGLIIRQRYLDAPRSMMHIACPEALVSQWTEELDTKVGMRSFRSTGQRIMAYDAEPEPFWALVAPDLLVIDEAHRIAAGWGSEDEEAQARFAAAAALATRTPRVLLLSATPVLHHEQTLLAMLHLLDPDTFRLEELDEFVKRMEGREEIARIFARINDEMPSFALKEAIGELREALSADERIEHLGATVEEVLEHETDDDQALKNAVSALRTHVSETYRVHGRVLRQRRSTVSEAGYRIRGRAGLVHVDVGEDLADPIETWLNGFRTALAEAAGVDQEQIELARRFFMLFLERASGDPAALAALARAVRTIRIPEYHRAGCSRADRSTVKAVWRSGALGPIREVVGELEALLSEDPADYTAWQEALWDALTEDGHLGASSDGDKAVVFTTAGDSARRAADFFADMGAQEVETITGELSTDERDEALQRFRDDPGCRYLFVDRTAEEGLNLQFASLVVMVDLPADAVRIEQRLGRVDRRSDAGPVRCLLLSPVAGGLVDLWLGALRDGFGVFDRSAAPIQFAVDHVEREFLRSLLLEGDSKATRNTDHLAEAVTAEQGRIDYVDNLDALATTPTREREIIESYLAAEADMPNAVDVLREVADAYGAQLGVQIDIENETTARIGVTDRNLITQRFPGVASEAVHLTQARPDLHNSEEELARPGAPAIEVLGQLLDWLPDGQTFAIRAHSDDYSLVGFCCDLLVRVATDEVMVLWREHETALPDDIRATRNAADAPLDASTFRRWADAYLPPVSVRVWVDPSAHCIDRDDLLVELEDALMKALDSSCLTEADWSRAEALAGVQSFDTLVQKLTKAAEDEAFRRAHEILPPELAIARFNADTSADLAQRRLRAERDGSPEARAELLAMEKLIPALGHAIASPRATWRGAGVVVLAQHGE